MSKNGELTLVMVGDVRVNRDEPTSAFKHVGDLLRGADFTKPVQDAPPLAVGRNERSWGRLDAYPKMKE